MLEVKEKISLLGEYRVALMGVATIMITLFHFSWDSSILKISTRFMYAGVDIFFLLSGYGLYHSLIRKFSLKTFYTRRILRILPAYWIWLISSQYKNLDVNVILQMFTIGLYNSNFPLEFWYIGATFLFYIFYPLIFSIQRRNVAYVLFIVLILNTIVIVCQNYNLINLSEVQYMTIYRFPIFCLGSIAAQYKNRFLTGKWLVLSIVTAILLLIYLYGHFGFLLKVAVENGTCLLPFLIITPPLCLLLTIIFSKNIVIVNKFFDFIGSISLEIYLIHQHVYMNFLRSWSFPGSLTTFFVCLFIYYDYCCICFTHIMQIYFITKKSRRKIYD